MISKYRGCLFGLAIGDALGAPVEFLSLSKIRERYGENEISDFHEWGGFPAGSYTDDTQMSLATAVGCIIASQGQSDNEVLNSLPEVYKCYLEWLKTQDDPEQRRAPGITCLSALGGGRMGTIAEKINDRKGCGGVMRTAPAGLAFPSGRAFEEGAKFAAITHGHPSGYLSAGFLAEMISHIIEEKSLDEAINTSMKSLVKYDEHEETLEMIELARKLSISQQPIDKSIKAIGAGWVGEEALAIAIYCSLKFSDDWKAGTLAAVNHSGDSDSTGSIAGSILGTLLGIESVPDKWIRSAEDAEKIKKIADDMFEIFHEGKNSPLMSIL